MCGINGFNFRNDSLAMRMRKFTKSRGPDADGIYIDNFFTILHDRLSILDLSSSANQPMTFENLIISYNGEIYNFKDLKKELINDGYKFKTNSDTEVILYLFHKYNIQAFKKLSGIFALAIWDKLNRKLYLVRDKVGVKPLYYQFNSYEKKFHFSSSVKSLLECSSSKKLNESAFLHYSNFGRNDLKETIFKDIFKLAPGELLIFDEKDSKYSINKFLKFSFKENDYSNTNIKDTIKQTIKSQLISDVPIALSLSGGVDSNIIYSAMRERFNNDFNIYSFYFKDYEKFNGDFYSAQKNAKFYKTPFFPVEISHLDFIDTAEKVVEILEEPLANQCSILNYKMANSINEKILITGDGGDEIFTGYDSYRAIHIINTLQKFNLLKNFKVNFGPKNFRRLFMSDPKDIYLSFSEQNIYKDLTKYYKNIKLYGKDDLKFNHCDEYKLQNRLNHICFLDLDSVIPNDFLLRNDKIFMSQGKEVRVPLLDVNLINKFLMMKEGKKFGNTFKSKNLLKKIFNNEIHSLVKGKWGMQSPYAKWLKGPLNIFAKEILSKEYYSNSDKYFNFDNIQRMLLKHQREYYNPALIWSLINLQLFLRKFSL